MILVTEKLLLRKTTAVQVKRLFREFFIWKYPRVEYLADADPQELRELIKKLGLSNQRSKQLISMAKLIKTDYGW